MHSVVLAEYDPTWPVAFHRESVRLLEAASGLLVGIHHIGSTSVPGLAAKPTIDMLGEIDQTELDSATLAPFLEPLGYQDQSARVHRPPPLLHLASAPPNAQSAHRDQGDGVVAQRDPLQGSLPGAIRRPPRSTKPSNARWRAGAITIRTATAVPRATSSWPSPTRNAALGDCHRQTSGPRSVLGAGMGGWRSKGGRHRRAPLSTAVAVLSASGRGAQEPMFLLWPPSGSREATPDGRSPDPGVHQRDPAIRLPHGTPVRQ